MDSRGAGSGDGEANSPRRADGKYCRAADDARRAARRAREIERNAAQPTPVQPGSG